MCSAPGGKAFTIFQSMNNSGKLYCFDMYEHRLKLINDGAKRLDIVNISASVNDATKYNDNIPKADKILCDVPCSGFGIIRRKPEIRYKELDFTVPEFAGFIQRLDEYKQWKIQR